MRIDPRRFLELLVLLMNVLREAVVLVILRIVGVRVRLGLFLLPAALEELRIGEEAASAQQCQHKEQGGQGVSLGRGLFLIRLVLVVLRLLGLGGRLDLRLRLGVFMRIDPRRFLELLVLLMICLWLTLICLNGFPKAYGGYAVSMLQWVQ